MEPFEAAGAVTVVVPPELDVPEPLVCEGAGVGEATLDVGMKEEVVVDLPPPHAIKREVVTHRINSKQRVRMILQWAQEESSCRRRVAQSGTGLRRGEKKH
jgi:hypothetical protein